ncbi:hypothetical protein DFS34DRAFT_377584 [Phlyctochytrium arcticum]|nr:hypothetical protein DFS34DRAFT_377584 [Phlyctochytrium arcticum]
MDGTSSIYTVSATRPAATDSSLQDLSFSSGTLSPAFSRNETLYVLAVPATSTRVQYVAKPLNAKASVRVVDRGVKTDKDNELELFWGDTPLELEVMSAVDNHTSRYFVIIRKDAPAYRPVTADTRVDGALICAVCGRLPQFRPRASTTCSHAFCLTCLTLLRRSGSRLEIATASGELKGYGCPFCLSSGTTKPAAIAWQQNPAWVVDEKLERLGTVREAKCPFQVYGCTVVVSLGQLASHVAACERSPETCSECGERDALDKLSAGKHHDPPCMTTCSMKLSVANQSRHEQVCKAETTPIKSVTRSSWETGLVDKKMVFQDIDAVLKAAKEKTTMYAASLAAAKKGPGMGTGQGPDVALLQDLASIYAIAIGLQSTHAEHHMNLGLILEEQAIVASLFPPAAKEVDQPETNAATESFMADEVKGLLLQLGIPPSASDPIQVRAMEAEYQRLKGLGLSDQAAEVQGLYTWKIQKIAGESGVAGWNGGGAAGNTSRLDKECYERALEKYQHAVMCAPDHYEGNYHVGRVLYKLGQSKDAVKYLTIAVARRPTFLEARMYWAIASKELDNLTSEEYQCISKDLEMVLQEYSDRSWLRTRVTGNELNAAIPGKNVDPDTLAVTSACTLWNPDFAQTFLLCHQAYLRKGQSLPGVEKLLDLIFLLPEQINTMPKQSNVAERLATYFLQAIDYLVRSASLGESTGTIIKQRVDNMIHTLIPTMIMLLEKTTLHNAQLHESMAQTLVRYQSSNADFHVYLGQCQLDVFEKLPDSQKTLEKLDEAEKTFEAALRGTTDGIKAQNWWLTREAEFKQYLQALETSKPKASTGGSTQVKKGPRTVKKPVAKPSPAPPVAPAARAALAKAPTKQVTPKAGKQVLEPSRTSKTDPEKRPVTATGRGAINPAASGLKSVTKTPVAPVGKTVAPVKKASVPPGAPLSTMKASAKPSLAATAKTTLSSPPKAASVADPQIATVEAAKSTNTTEGNAPAPLSVQTPAGALLGLGRTLAQRLAYFIERPSPDWSEMKPALLDRTTAVYSQAIAANPTHHDAYIELAPILEKHVSLAASADLLTSYPFVGTNPSESPLEADLYIHSEINRALIKLKRFRDPALTRGLIAEGRRGGLGGLEKFVQELDKAGENKVLMDVYAGVNRKALEDPDMQAFFKARYWL